MIIEKIWHKLLEVIVFSCAFPPAQVERRNVHVLKYFYLNYSTKLFFKYFVDINYKNVPSHEITSFPELVKLENSKWRIYFLTNFSPVSHLYTLWKRQKTKGFLTFSGGIEMWHWTKMGSLQLHFSLWNTIFRSITTL